MRYVANQNKEVRRLKISAICCKSGEGGCKFMRFVANHEQEVGN